MGNPVAQPRGDDAVDAWLEELNQRAEALGRSKECILVLGQPQDEEEEEEEEEEEGPTLSALRAAPVIICPRPVEDRVQALGEELGTVGSISPDNPFRMLNTSSSHEGHAILRRALGRLDTRLTSGDWAEAFTSAAALLAVAKAEDWWYMDTDAPEVVADLVKKMDEQWGKLWERSAEELGGVTSSDRETINAVRDAMKQDVQQYCGGDDV